ncbi:MAG: S9 family peptidase [Gemmatimonadetes bacterium]|nr:S9 family peptidase [Gemmatimonadota bacterium]MYC90535.1 S9 family peptidase [Gemmatimonadota bacterium]MYG36123.1 S9 family peptidase [Gemmatimonadota bacterium]MYJ18832.1 S9 family peptidase [Gemmatimonadota bacterium]
MRPSVAAPYRSPATPAIACLLGAAVLTAASSRPAGAQEEILESFRAQIALKSVGAPRISPDGSMIAFSVTATDWENNRFDQEIWLVVGDDEPFQLTRTEPGSSTGPQWTPDGSRLGFIADRGDRAQVYLIRPEGGEAEQLTTHNGGVGAFRFSPDGSRIAFTATDHAPDAFEEREERYGAYAVEDADFRMTHLWVAEARAEAEPRRLTEGTGYTVGGGFGGGSFDWSPDGREIAFGHTPTPQINSFPHADISVVDVDAGTVRPLATDPGPESGPMWSPDGARILYSTTAGANPFYGNTELAVIPSGGGEPRIVTTDFDENPSPVAWTDEGILFVASQRTARHLFLLDPESGQVTLQTDTPEMIMTADLSDDGTAMAIQGENRTTVGEIFRLSRGVGTARAPRRVTDMTGQVGDWGDLGSREVIRWESEDGAEIEGVLMKPPGYDPERTYPLMVVIHGGPTGTSRPQLIGGYVYPVIEWLRKGAVVMMPNYRGSAGYGADFRALNVRNLGVGDAWDVLSGVEALVDRGIADPDRVAAMGWSQGGYISAFLTTSSDRFRAISVGAGISNWMTYYVNTDIHSFTREYLEATPWDDPEIYAKTSPMTYIRQASTPTLIQHGEFDARVPTPNAYELYQGLQDVGVDTRLIIYKGFGHGITKPRERLAAMWHNWEWFARHIWGEAVAMPITEGGGGR